MTGFLNIIGIVFYCWMSVHPAITPLHDFHTSIAEMDYDESSKSFEISLRVFTNDFEEGLSNAGGIKNLHLDNTKKYQALIEKYIREHFYLITAKKERLPFKLYGKEIEGDVTWIYFEIPVKKLSKSLQLKNAVLTELFSDQTNIVNIRYKKQKKTYMFQRRNILQGLKFE